MPEHARPDEQLRRGEWFIARIPNPDSTRRPSQSYGLQADAAGTIFFTAPQLKDWIGGNVDDLAKALRERGGSLEPMERIA